MANKELWRNKVQTLSNKVLVFTTDVGMTFTHAGFVAICYLS